MATIEETNLGEELDRQESTEEPTAETKIDAVDSEKTDHEPEVDEPEESVPPTAASPEEIEKPMKTPTKKTESKSPKKESPKKETPKRTPRNETFDENTDSVKPGAYDQPLVVEGKRERTKVTHFASTLTPKVESPKAEAMGGKGAGMALGDIASANEYITKKPTQDLKKLHKLLYLREGQAAHSIVFKKALRKFNGWWFTEKSDDWNKRVSYLQKLKVAEVKHLRAGVGLHHAAPTRDEEISNLMHFLLNPAGKSTQIEAEKKEKAKERKRKRQTKVKMPSKKRKLSGKSDSEDEEDDEDDKEEEEDEVSDDPPSDKEEKKKPTKKAAPKQTSAKKPAAKKSKEKIEDSDEEMEEEKNNKKGDSDTDDSSESGENKEKEKEDTAAPSDSHIEKTVRDLLKTFDLSQVSMKQMVQAVCDKFPDSDLEERKGFLKEMIKKLLSENE
ncbi:unnamed protein product, partial [Mesorhabditis belari]|uniref:DEK-C domain-containing protein n=1 Tax=Mesorhabditis belari TaxID=2138241 RepID=A0AAF3EJA9_9BILA